MCPITAVGEPGAPSFGPLVQECWEGPVPNILIDTYNHRSVFIYLSFLIMDPEKGDTGRVLKSWLPSSHRPFLNIVVVVVFVDRLLAHFFNIKINNAFDSILAALGSLLVSFWLHVGILLAPCWSMLVDLAPF